MKRYAILFLLLIACDVAFAQKSEAAFSVIHEVVGYNESSGTDIMAKQYKFPRRIFISRIDTTLGVLMIQLRDTVKRSGNFKNMGQVLIYDVNHDQVLWDKFLNYQQDRMEMFGQFMIQSSRGMSEVYYTIAGNKVREDFGRYVGVYKDINLGLMIPSDISGDPKNRLVGMNMFSGEKLWERKMDHGYGMKDVVRVNDSVIVVVSGGLHAVNLNSGKGWDYDLEIGKKNYSASIFGSLAGLMVGVLSRGSVAFFVVGHNVRNMHSNVIVSDSAIYMAGRKNIVRLDMDGNVVWKDEMAEDAVTMSSIFIKNEIVYMVNTGEVLRNQRAQKCGKSFLAAFDAGSGKRKFLTLFGEDKVFTRYKVRDSSVVLLEKEGLQVHALADQIVLAEMSCDTSVYGELLDFVGKKIYTDRGKHFECLADVDSAWVNVYTSKKRVLTMDASLKIVANREWDDFYICYSEKDGYKFLLKDGKTIVLNKQNRKVADINVDDNSVIVGNALHNISKTAYSVIDLSSILMN